MIAYAITDPTTLNFNTLSTDLQRFSQKADMIVYRDKATTNYQNNASLFLAESKKYNFSKVLLHSDYKLAHKLKADGVHLTSLQLSDIQKAKDLGLFVVVSTHSLDEALEAQKLGADLVTFSPVFTTPNKGEPKGVEELNRVVSKLSIGVIALGGIVSSEQIEACRKSGAFGFASIRYFR